MVYRYLPANQARIVSGHWPPNYNLPFCPIIIPSKQYKSKQNLSVHKLG